MSIFLNSFSYVEVNLKVTSPKIRDKLDTTLDQEMKSLKLKKKTLKSTAIIGSKKNKKDSS